MEYKINEFLTLKLLGNKTHIYVKGKKFNQCKKLVLNIPIENAIDINEIDSIDEAAQFYKKETLDREESYLLTPEQEFWAHCSNLEGWYVHSYDTRLLHRSLSFPLLEDLVKANDSEAKRIFKDEIAKRFRSGYPPVIEFLIFRGYLNYLNTEEVDMLSDYVINTILDQANRVLDGMLDKTHIEHLNLIFKDFDYQNFIDQHFNNANAFLHKLIELGITGASEYYHHQEFLKRFMSSDDIHFFQEFSSKDILFLQDSHFKFDIFGIHSCYAFPPAVLLASKKIVGIYLKEIDINEVPDTIGHSTFTEKMDLRRNNLKTLPTSMSNLKSLRKLNLGHNHFNEVPPVLFQLTSLEKLDFSINTLKELPDLFSNLKSLKYLDLSRNSLKELPESISKLDHLLRFDVSFNDLEELPDSLGELGVLESVRCEYNKIESLPKSISDLKSLRRLFLDGNPLKSLPDSILSMNSLKMVSINPEFLDEDSKNILRNLEKKVFISKPPYSINFFLVPSPTFFHSKDRNTRKKFGPYVNPNWLPLTSDLIDKLKYLTREDCFEKIEDRTPEFITTFNKAVETLEQQLGKDFIIKYSD